MTDDKEKKNYIYLLRFQSPLVHKYNAISKNVAWNHLISKPEYAHIPLVVSKL